MRRGTARRKLDKKKEALADFRQILKLDPDDKMAQRETAALEQVDIMIKTRMKYIGFAISTGDETKL